jgi:phosphoribosyl 1,2-cyclic phosphodiesterase
LTLKERIRRSFSPPLFPIDLMDTPAEVVFHDLPKTQWSIGSAKLTASLIVHPGPTVGYRVEADGSSVAYIPDHEPALAGDFTQRSRDWISGGSIAQDVDLLLHDAQYFEEEYDGRLGWGHSSVEGAVAYADAVGARRLVLFHHDPTHSDDHGATSRRRPGRSSRRRMICRSSRAKDGARASEPLSGQPRRRAATSAWP